MNADWSSASMQQPMNSLLYGGVVLLFSFSISKVKSEKYDIDVVEAELANFLILFSKTFNA